MICGLLFAATAINYVDRQVIGILKPVLSADLRWNEIDYSNIVFAFQLAYALAYVVMGRVVDWLGTRKGFSLAVVVWSLAAMAHAAVSSVFGFGLARFALGLGEGANFPACMKTVSEWFPRRERALATGIFNAGSNVGALITPLTVPWITLHFGWRWAFIVTGSFGFAWLALWLLLYRKPALHPRLSPEELAYIQDGSSPTSIQVPWITLLRQRQTWAIALAKFMTDPFWWLYLFWVPDFLHKAHGITLLNVGLPLVVIYVMADVGSVGGGWLSSALLKAGWSLNAARKAALLASACGVVPILFAARASHLWVAVALIGLAAASHQGWSANIYTLVTDMFPQPTVGSVTGLVGMAGAVGGLIIAKVVGYILQSTGSYFLIFLMAGCAYLLGFALLHLLSPRLRPARLESA